MVTDAEKFYLESQRQDKNILLLPLDIVLDIPTSTFGNSHLHIVCVCVYLHVSSSSEHTSEMSQEPFSKCLIFYGTDWYQNSCSSLKVALSIVVYRDTHLRESQVCGGALSEPGPTPSASAQKQDPEHTVCAWSSFAPLLKGFHPVFQLSK